MTCQYCARRRADQTLFTTFMRCGEGNATKRTAHLCERCRQHAMLVLDSIGMVVAFEDDGQLDWDAHVTLSENATRSLARRATQREDLLLQFHDPSAPSRAQAPARPEKHSILHQLAAEGLIESTVDRGREFWPEDTCRLTGKGDEAAACIRKRRTAEAGGLPLDEWNPLYVPEQATEDEFREHAEQQVISPEGERYDAGPHLMLRRNDGGPGGESCNAEQTHPFFDDELWTTRPARPAGYFFVENVPAIAFDADNVQVLAEYYELIRAVAGPDVQWTVMEPTPMNPMYSDGPAARTIRADGPAARTTAFVSIFTLPAKRSARQELGRQDTTDTGTSPTSRPQTQPRDRPRA